MVAKFSVMGSCVNRNIFNSTINKDYKKYFLIVNDAVNCSIISLMSDPIYDDEILNLTDDKHISNMLKNDFNKNYLKNLIESSTEYLLIDNYFEAKFGIIFYEESIITNNFWLYPKLAFSEKIKNCKGLQPILSGAATNRNNMDIDFKKYYKLWTENIDNFFQLINEKRPDIKIILNPARNSFKINKKDGLIHDVDPLQKKLLTEENNCIAKFDDYIINNFDVEHLKYETFNADDVIYPFAFNYVHYESKYYIKINQCLNEFIEKNNQNKV